MSNNKRLLICCVVFGVLSALTFQILGKTEEKNKSLKYGHETYCFECGGNTIIEEGDFCSKCGKSYDEIAAVERQAVCEKCNYAVGYSNEFCEECGAKNPLVGKTPELKKISELKRSEWNPIDVSLLFIVAFLLMACSIISISGLILIGIFHSVEAFSDLIYRMKEVKEEMKKNQTDWDN